MEMKVKESLFSRNNHQKWLPLKLLCRILILIFVLVSLANPSMSSDPCDSDLSVPTLDDFYVKVLHLTGTSVRIKWNNPKLIQKIYPDYYCIVYNSENVLAESNPEFQFEITNLTTNIFYDIYVKPCVNGNCFGKSKTCRVHT